MIKSFAKLLVLFALALTASAASEENVTREINSAPGEKLVVDVDFGSVNVTAGGEDKVVLEAHRKIDFGDEAKEKEYLANVPITLTKEGNVTREINSRPREKFFLCFVLGLGNWAGGGEKKVFPPPRPSH